MFPLAGWLIPWSQMVSDSQAVWEQREGMGWKAQVPALVSSVAALKVWPLNHRISEWFGLESTLKTILFPCRGQGHLY